jgi:hypothetical protein
LPVLALIHALFWNECASITRTFLHRYPWLREHKARPDDPQLWQQASEGDVCMRREASAACSMGPCRPAAQAQAAGCHWTPVRAAPGRPAPPGARTGAQRSPALACILQEMPHLSAAGAGHGPRVQLNKATREKTDEAEVRSRKLLRMRGG